jgi:hypothetical protein
MQIYLLLKVAGTYSYHSALKGYEQMWKLSSNMSKMQNSIASARSKDFLYKFC